MVGSTATERVRAVVAGPLGIVLLTTERFVNTTTKVAVPWTTTLGPDAAAFASGRVYGAVAQGNQILVAGGMGSSLGLMVLDTDGNLVRSGVDAQALDNLAGDTITTLPFGGGLLMFDGNPPRLTQIGFDLSRIELGHNTQMRTFYRSAPRVAPIVLMGGQPVGVWLTVFPGTDDSQGNTSHQLYACALDVDDPADVRDHASDRPDRARRLRHRAGSDRGRRDARREILRRRPQRRGQPDLAARRGHVVHGERESGLAEDLAED